MSDASQSEKPTETQVAEVKKAPPPLLAGGGIGAIIPQDIDQVWRLATILVQAEMAPKSLNTPAKCTVAIMHGLEVGLKPMQAIQSIAVINNMPSIYGDAMLALVMASPVYGDHVESLEYDDQGIPWKATCSAVRKGEFRWRTQEMTRARAQKAGWWSKAGPWSSTPDRMLQMRARGWCLRDTFPDVLRGLVMAEEAADLVDITDRGTATTTAPPEPKRTDFTKDGPHRASRGKVTDVPHDPRTGVVAADGAIDQQQAKDEPQDAPAATSWKIPDDIVGMDPRIAWLSQAALKADTTADIDAIESENAEFIGKTGRRQSDIKSMLRNRRAILEKDGE